jgi:hypothetical protein
MPSNLINLLDSGSPFDSSRSAAPKSSSAFVSGLDGLPTKPTPNPVPKILVPHHHPLILHPRPVLHTLTPIFSIHSSPDQAQQASMTAAAATSPMAPVDMKRLLAKPTITSVVNGASDSEGYAGVRIGGVGSGSTSPTAIPSGERGVGGLMPGIIAPYGQPASVFSPDWAFPQAHASQLPPIKSHSH